MDAAPSPSYINSAVSVLASLLSAHRFRASQCCLLPGQYAPPWTVAVQIDKVNAGFSLHPLVAIAHQLSLHLRFKLGPLALLALVEGHRRRKKGNTPPVSLDGIYEIFADELLYLDEHGCRVYDSHNKQWFTCRVRLLNLQSDSRGLQSMLHIPGAPALHPCHLCWKHGFKTEQCGKVIYPAWGQDLPVDHPLRPLLESLNQPSRLRAAGQQMPVGPLPRGRTLHEIAVAAKEPVQGQEGLAYCYDGAGWCLACIVAPRIVPVTPPSHSTLPASHRAASMPGFLNRFVHAFRFWCSQSPPSTAQGRRLLVGAWPATGSRRDKETPSRWE